MSRDGPISLTLKQKLSALSLAPSTPTTLHSYSDQRPGKTPTSPKKKSFFDWVKREFGEEERNEEPSEAEKKRVDMVLQRLICQAGLDYETRPMVVITAAALPDPHEVSYDVLLQRLLLQLDLYVENDYTVVFLTAGGRYTPGWNWVWKAYRSLNRKYRKNLKRLYIVHSTFFSKMLFSLAGAIISPKFFRKIQYISTLSELADNVPLTQIDISPAVYQENLKYEREITLPVQQHTSVFGVPLEILMGQFGENGGLPRVVRDCVEYLRECGMEVDGLFRRSPNSVLLRQAKEAYDRGHPVSLSSFADPHIAAVLLKKFFRDLPEPIFHEDMYPIIRRCPIRPNGSSDLATVTFIRDQILPALQTDAAEILLSYVFHLLHDVSLRSSINRMDAHNLALCITPNLVGSNPVRDLQMCTIPGGPPMLSSPLLKGSPESTTSDLQGHVTVGMVVKFCIERYFEIFEEPADRSQAVSPVGFESSSNMAGSVSSEPLSSSTAEEDEDDEDLDDAMLVMPLGPTTPGSSSFVSNGTPRSPSATWNKHRRYPSSTSNGRHTITAGSGRSRHKTGGSIGGPKGNRSLVSIDNAIGKNGGRGSITLGKPNGRAANAPGAGVEAVSVTALGFFTPPSSESKPHAETETASVSSLHSSVSDLASAHPAHGAEPSAISQP
ncbi:hypothetical protein FRC03_006441 [Tulasnella sp. 419]|nr:hypothetical protein FRC03_006441 [Tulasnella sp. 419]